MADKLPTERIQALETADQYEKREIARLQGEVATLLAWKAQCDTSNKLFIKILLFISAVASGIGYWLDNIKSALKTIIGWASS